MKTAIIYARTKGDLTDFGLMSVKGQFEVCKEYAEKNDIKVVGLFSDTLLIGSKFDFPNWQSIVKTINPNYNYILIDRNCRIGRNSEKVLNDRATLKKHGVRIISVSEPMSEENADFMYMVMEAINNVGNI